MERDVRETDTTTGLGSPSLEGSGQPLPTGGRPAPTSPSFVYALGQIEPRFPSLAVEKEFVQGIGRTDAAGLTDREALVAVLSDRANRYLLRQLCWVFVVEGVETYLLTPRDSADLELLVEAVRPRPNPTDLDVVIGVRGPLARPEVCNGLVVHIIVFDQLYSFDRAALLNAIPRPDDVPEKEDKRFRAAAAELLDRIVQLADNAGASDEHRALNYLAVRDPAIYARTAAAHAGNASLTAVDVRSSRLSGVRKIVDVIFSYTHRQTAVTEKYFARVDVTEEFPFLVTKLSPYYER
jgi:PatG C-terminal